MNEGGETRRASRLPRLGARAAILAAVIVVVLLALWLARKPIATRYIDQTVAAAHVSARYGIADLGLGRQRLTNVVLGDPAHPDLVADWIETRTHIGLDGASVLAVRAGHVRLRGRIVGGTLSLGSIDRLLPASSGKPFALPAIDLDVADGRMRLEMPQGILGLKLAGSGRLDGGFAGTLAAVSERIAVGDCAATRVVAAVDVRVRKGEPSATGPVRASGVACAGASVARPTADVSLTLGAAIESWRGSAMFATGAVAHPAGTLAGMRGTIGFGGTARATAGKVDLAGEGVRMRYGSARAVTVAGDYRTGEAMAFAGRVRAGGAAVSPAMLATATGWSGGAAGTPVAPIARAVARAIAAAGRGFALDSDVAVTATSASVSRAILASSSGARVALGGGSGVSFGWSAPATSPAKAGAQLPPGRNWAPAFAGEGLGVDTSLATRGGGLPTARFILAQAAPGSSIDGTATIAPYTADGASIAIARTQFTAIPGGTTRIAGGVTLSGPLGDGRIDGLTVPIAALWDGRGRLIVNPACAPISFARLAAAGLVLGQTRLALCPVDGALLTLNGGRIGGGARIAAPRLAGSLGGTPITLAANQASLRISDRRFLAAGLAVRLGAPDRVSRLDLATLDGRLADSAIAGHFTGGAGAIGAVPLLMSGAGGDWRFAGGNLSVNAKLMVADAAADPRFKPLAANDVTLGLANGVIAVTGTLATPDTATKIADVRIAHTLASGTGHADLTVPGITFGKDFQPDRLTRLTFGVIAEVAGSVNGAGHIAWTPAGVTSTGTFSTTGTDLAAAFGPVTGIAGTIRFTDLLALESAPGQVATIKTINPGIPVNDGTITYQTYADARILVNSGRWPFAGGTLTLDPTLLDFSAPAARRMTFRVDGMAADQFLQQFDFKNLDATGVFDGVLPMIFDASGGRIENGNLTVRAGGGTLAYVGEVSQKDVGVWGNLAFQALKSLRYRSLDIVMNGALAGEMITEVHFAGISQGQGAKSNFLIRRLQKLPLVFNVKIKAPFRGLLDSAQSFYDPKRLIERNLPALLQEQNKAALEQQSKAPIQPPASRTVP